MRMGEVGNVHKMVAGMFAEKRPFGGARITSKDNIKIDISEIRIKGRFIWRLAGLYERDNEHSGLIKDVYVVSYCSCVRRTNTLTVTNNKLFCSL